MHSAEEYVLLISWMPSEAYVFYSGDLDGLDAGQSLREQAARKQLISHCRHRPEV